MFYSFRSKVSALIIGWTLFASLLLSYFLLSFTRDVSYSEFERKSIELTDVFAQNLSKPLYVQDSYPINRILSGLKKNDSYLYIVVYTSTGKILSSFDSFDTKKLSGDLFKDVNTKYIRKSSHSRGLYDGQKVFDCIVPVSITNKTIGFVRIGFSMASLTESDKKALYVIISVFFGVIIVSVLCSLLIVDRMMRPVNNIIKITKEISKGNLDYWVPVKASSEMGELVQSFKKMINDLRYARKENKKNQAQLQLSLGSKTEEAKKLERQLVQSDRFSIIKEFTGGIAHELKNPFTSILGYAQIAKEKLQDKEKIEDANDVKSLYTYFDFVEKDINSCRTMIDDLLNFSRPTDLRLEPFDTNAAILEEVEMIKPQFESKNLKIIQNLAENMPKIKANKEKIKQVIRNILVNARKFMDENGELVIYTAIRSEENRDYIEMRFRDDGIGILEEDLGKIFLPFFTTKHGGEGTGLGMSISYGIIKNHQGSIEVDSVYGHGTTFKVRIPVDL